MKFKYITIKVIDNSGNQIITGIYLSNCSDYIEVHKLRRERQERHGSLLWKDKIQIMVKYFGESSGTLKARYNRAKRQNKKNFHCDM